LTVSIGNQANQAIALCIDARLSVDVILLAFQERSYKIW